MNNTPPGWYPDLNDATQLRYWDGTQWTTHTSPVQQPAPFPAQPPAPHFAPPQHALAPLPPQQNWFLRHKVLSAVLALFVVGALANAVSGGSSNDEAPASATTSPGSSTQDNSVSDQQQSKPKQSQREKFVAIVEKGEDAADGANQIKVVQARKKRGAAICSLLPRNLHVNGWTGKVEDVSTEVGGDSAVFEISLTDEIKLGTWNNSLSDMGSHTLIKPSDSLYDALGDLEEGDTVKVSGDFIRDSADCVQEQSLIDENGMATPTFSFDFSSVTKD